MKLQNIFINLIMHKAEMGIPKYCEKSSVLLFIYVSLSQTSLKVSQAAKTIRQQQIFYIHLSHINKPAIFADLLKGMILEYDQSPCR